MATLEQKYYELLTRTDHPVFKKDFSEVQDGTSPFNSIFNRLLAKQMVRMREALDALKPEMFPQTATELSISQWEDTYFGFSKFGIDLATRIEELLKKRNNQLTMSVKTVILLAEAIVGQTPRVLRNLSALGGWVMDVAALDVDTIFPEPGTDNGAQTYVVIFETPVSSDLLKRLDNELTRIEKGGSKHILLSPARFWVSDVAALEVDSLLG
jgi:hypothetical protein